jgi:multidrug efflux system outer membrane protein
MKAIRTSIVWAVSFCAGVTAVSSGCSMAPTYKRAAVPEPQAFKESPTLTPEEVGTWKQAEPSESYSRGEWWRVFDDLQQSSVHRQSNPRYGWRMGSRKAGGRPHAPPAKYPKA